VVDYYRLIDIYEKDDLLYFIIIFLLVCSSVLIVFPVGNYILQPLDFHLNGFAINDFLYCVFGIGMVEEFAKLVTFGLFYLVFKKHLNEPIDYIALMCTSALGFAAVENTLYFTNHGANLISGRALFSTVCHMIASALVAYGWVLYKYHPSKPGFRIIVLYFFYAMLAHGIYDFFLLYEGTKSYGIILSIIFFLLMITVFAVIMNNCLNNSGFFTYKKVVNSYEVSRTLIIYYGIVFLLQGMIMAIEENIMVALWGLLGVIAFYGTIPFALRLSRFKLVEKRWESLSLSLPFHFKSSHSFGGTPAHPFINVKGDGYNESFISQFYNEYLIIKPYSHRNSYLNGAYKAYIEEKIFLKDFESFFLLRLYTDPEAESFEHYLIKPKMTGATFNRAGEIIVGLLKFDDPAMLEDRSLSISDFRLLEWAVISEYE